MKVKDILIVDDNFLWSSLTRLILKSEGFDVAAAKNGIDALQKLGNCDFRMVITDFNMPEMSGLELAVKVREQYPETQVVMVTAADMADIAESAVAAGIVRLFAKTFEAQHFVSEIRYLLNQTSNSPSLKKRYHQ